MSHNKRTASWQLRHVGRDPRVNAYLGGRFSINSSRRGLPMTKPEANEAGYLKARIHHAVASAGPGIVIFAVIVAAQIIVGSLGFVFDHVLDHRFDLWLTSTTRR